MALIASDYGPNHLKLWLGVRLRVQCMWTIVRHDGPDRLGLWFNQVCGFPYEVPEWGPAAVAMLAGHSCDPSPIDGASSLPSCPRCIT